MDTLPSELIFNICKFIDNNSLLNFSSISNKYRWIFDELVIPFNTFKIGNNTIINNVANKYYSNNDRKYNHFIRKYHDRLTSISVNYYNIEYKKLIYFQYLKNLTINYKTLYRFQSKECEMYFKYKTIHLSDILNIINTINLNIYVQDSNLKQYEIFMMCKAKILNIFLYNITYSWNSLIINLSKYSSLTIKHICIFIENNLICDFGYDFLQVGGIYSGKIEINIENFKYLYYMAMCDEKRNIFFTSKLHK